MTPQQFLIHKLQTGRQYDLTERDGDLLEKGMDEFLYRQIVRKKFRKWSIGAETERHVRSAIAIQLSYNAPIRFTLPFGAYKRWNMPSAPKADWAEFFSLAYYARYMAPIAAAYEPGCIFSFVGDDVIVPRLDNYPEEEVAQWSETFEELIGVFHQHLPPNLRFQLLHVRDFYAPEEFEKELQEKYKLGKAEWDSWDERIRKAHLASSAHNIKWDGIHDWRGLSEGEKENKILEAAILHNVYRQLERRKAYTRGKNRIAVFPHKISKAIPLGTTNNSTVYFWVGTGILEKREGGFTERILSYEQWQDRKDDLRAFPANINGIPMGSIMVDARAS